MTTTIRRRIVRLLSLMLTLVFAIAAVGGLGLSTANSASSAGPYANKLDGSFFNDGGAPLPTCVMLVHSAVFHFCRPGRSNSTSKLYF